MQLNKLYMGREIFERYPEQTFVPLNVDIGLQKPILFLSNKKAVMEAGYYSLDPIEEQNYDINIITADSVVLMYMINIKAPIWQIHNNGLIIRNRIKWDNERDMEGVAPRYTLDDFIVVQNKNNTCSIFCKNLTSDQKT